MAKRREVDVRGAWNRASVGWRAGVSLLGVVVFGWEAGRALTVDDRRWVDATLGAAFVSTVIAVGALVLWDRVSLRRRHDDEGPS